ncbi:MAG: HNH endonuclease [Actinobacteria bacterium]|nr:HNH endonuclease [Actinomycetota bacterium]
MEKQGAWYCGRECWQNHRPRKRPVECKYCGGDFLRKPSSTAKFCSRACSNKARTGIKYDGSRSRDKSLSWLVLRRLVVQRDGEYCLWCNLGVEWNGKPLTLQLDHIDGDRNNNELDNLRLLCPNCHTQTDTWGGRANRAG